MVHRSTASRWIFPADERRWLSGETDRSDRHHVNMARLRMAFGPEHAADPPGLIKGGARKRRIATTLVASTLTTRQHRSRYDLRLAVTH